MIPLILAFGLWGCSKSKEALDTPVVIQLTQTLFVVMDGHYNHAEDGTTGVTIPGNATQKFVVQDAGRPGCYVQPENPSQSYCVEQGKSPTASPSNIAGIWLWILKGWDPKKGLPLVSFKPIPA
jgi:hypothetical protein